MSVKAQVRVHMHSGQGLLRAPSMPPWRQVGWTMDFERDWDSKGTVDHQQALHPEAAALAAKGKAVHPGKMHHADVVRTVAPNPDGTVVLPAGTDINQIEVSGRNLIVHLPDGTDMLILDGAEIGRAHV